MNTLGKKTIAACCTLLFMAQQAAAMPSLNGMHQTLKTKFIEGNVVFMSLVALTLILGLAFAIERIIFLTLSDTNPERLMTQLRDLLSKGHRDDAVTLLKRTKGPVAALCLQALARQGQPAADVERALASAGTIATAQLEKGCSWIKLFIAMAPSLGFLGTVVGMVMAFDNIQMAGDLSATVVAEGMKVALITTVFGIIVALILQLFYNYILNKIDALVTDMEATSAELMDLL